MADKFDDKPHSKVGFSMSHDDFDTDIQRNILMHYIHDRNLDDDWLEYINHHFPEDDDERRILRAEMQAKLKRLKKALNEE